MRALIVLLFGEIKILFIDFLFSIYKFGYTKNNLILVAVIGIGLISARPKEQKNCEQICTHYYKPLCAAPSGNKNSPERETFPNNCLLQVRNCESKKSKFTKIFYCRFHYFLTCISDFFFKKRIC